MTTEIDETLNKIQSEHKGVMGVVVVNSEGSIIKSTLNSNADIGDNFPILISEIVDRSKGLLKDNDELTFLKIRTNKVEYIIVPDKEFLLITLLNLAEQ